MPNVIIPAPLRDLSAGASSLEVPGGTLEEVLRAVDQRCPGFYARIVDSGRIRPELAVAVNGELESAHLHNPIPYNAEVVIIPAIGGG